MWSTEKLGLWLRNSRKENESHRNCCSGDSGTVLAIALLVTTTSDLHCHMSRPEASQPPEALAAFIGAQDFKVSPRYHILLAPINNKDAIPHAVMTGRPHGTGQPMKL